MNSSRSMSMKRSCERILSAGLIHMSLMHSGHEDFLMQENTFKGRMNLGSNSVSAWKPVRASPSGSTQSSSRVDQRLTSFFLATYRARLAVEEGIQPFQLFQSDACFCARCPGQWTSPWSGSTGHGGYDWNVVHG